MTYDEMAAIIKAAIRGETIEYRYKACADWHVAEKPQFDFINNEYRIKPAEPKLVPHWPALCGDGTYVWVSGMVFPNLEAAKKYSRCVIRLATEYPPIMLEVEE